MKKILCLRKVDIVSKALRAREAHTVIVVPSFPAHGLGSALMPGFGGTRMPSE